MVSTGAYGHRPTDNLMTFVLIEPVYRLAEQEWKDFVEHFTDDMIEVDPQIPPLPPKDVIHRIYRDVRIRSTFTQNYRDHTLLTRPAY